MDYSQLADAINEKTKAIIAVDIAGKVCDYDTIYQVVEKKRSLYRASNKLQKTI
jgi:dTDP-4-amino-4,6-dideoxygalactose transaminase